MLLPRPQGGTGDHAGVCLWGSATSNGAASVLTVVAFCAPWNGGGWGGGELQLRLTTSVPLPPAEFCLQGPGLGLSSVQVQV